MRQSHAVSGRAVPAGAGALLQKMLSVGRREVILMCCTCSQQRALTQRRCAALCQRFAGFEGRSVLGLELS